MQRPFHRSPRTGHYNCVIALVRGLLLVILVLATTPAAAQDLGHRIIGTLGSRAGEQRDAGLYVADRLAFYGASTFRDRNGAELTTDGARLEVLANAFGLAATLQTAEPTTYVSFAAAVPLASVSVTTEAPEASVDRLGVSDVFLQPLGVGWRLSHVDVVASYSIYIPTGLFRIGELGLSRGHVTHQFGLGGTVFFDTERRYRISALASYDLNQTKSGVDITRGDTMQVQGGAGALFFDLLDVGLVAAGMWQVRDDRGTEIPPVLRGAREQVVGLGAELGVIVAPIHGRVGVRYLWETAAETRPEGHVLVFELAVVAWTPTEDE